MYSQLFKTGSAGHPADVPSVSDFVRNPVAMERESKSAVQELFRGAGVLVTGCTGFLGLLLLEKLLRSCPGVKTVFLLIRSKKGKTEATRFAEIFDEQMFDSMKKACPDYLSKVRLVVGDCELPNLGLADADRELLCQEVNIVFHMAATVRFLERLKTAVYINVRGTKHLLELAKLMSHLKAFVHVSTAYANCPEKRIEERFYPVPLEYDKAIEMVELLQEDEIDIITPILLKDWPNTYAFTKAIAEDAVRGYGKGLPLAVVRPSIVIGTAKEPIPGWINNIYGPTGVAVAAWLGMLRTLHCNPDMVADLVPADMVVNMIIATAWDVATRHRLNAERLQYEQFSESLPIHDDIPIFNYVSSTQNPMTWGHYLKWCEVGTEYPSVKIVWCYGLQLHKYRIMNTLNAVFVHLLPAVIVDTAARLVGKKPILWQAYKKINKFLDVLTYFCTQEWKFTDDNVQSIWSRMTSLDRQLFDFNIAGVDWPSVLRSYMAGLRVHVIKDLPDTFKVAEKRYGRLKIAHYTLVYFLRFLLHAVITWVTISVIL